MLLYTGLPDEAAASFQQAGPLETWSPPPFHVLYTYACGARAAADLGCHEDLALLLERLEEFRGEHVVAEGVAYLVLQPQGVMFEVLSLVVASTGAGLVQAAPV